jgi:hypothetical protein
MHRTVEGAPRIVRRKANWAIRRTVTIKPQLDQRVIERMEQDDLSYSAVIEGALRILFGEHAAQS